MIEPAIKSPASGASLASNPASLPSEDATSDRVNEVASVRFDSSEIFYKAWQYKISDCDYWKKIDLDLSENELDAIPNRICNMTHVMHLYFYKNNLESLPELLIKLKNLKVLDLSQNKLKAVPDWLLDMQPSCKIYLTGNPLERPEIERLRKLMTAGLYKISELVFKDNNGNNILDVTQQRRALLLELKSCINALRRYHLFDPRGQTPVNSDSSESLSPISLD